MTNMTVIRVNFSALVLIVLAFICLFTNIQAQCRGKTTCQKIRQCASVMSLLESLHKPLKPSVVQFLRSQECGFADGLPKICCGVLPKTIRINKTHEKKVKKSKQRSKQLAITEKQDGNGIWKPHFNISVSTAPPGASVAHHLRGIIRDEEATIFKQAFEKLLVGNTRIDLTYNLPMRRRRSHDLDIEVR